MRTHFRFVGMAAALVLAALVLAQDSWTLKRVAEVGQTSKYRLSAELELGGMQATLSGLVIEKVTAVDPNGGYTIESTQSEMKVALMGEEMEIPESGAITTIFAPNGQVIKLQGEEVDGSAYRMANLGAFRYPSGPVKVGDEWTVEIPANTETGEVKATATFKVEATELISERQAIKIRMTVKEGEGTEAATSDSLVWMDPKDGTLLKSEATWSNAPVPGAPGPVSAKVNLTLEK